LEIERRREVEERYADAQDGPGAVAGGGGDWKETENVATENKLKRGRSPDDDGDNLRVVRKPFINLRQAIFLIVLKDPENEN
jgi:nuclear cap-binding protein subunit 2